MGRAKNRLSIFTREKIERHLAILSHWYLAVGAAFLILGGLGLWWHLRPVEKTSEHLPAWSSHSDQKAWGYFHPTWDDSKVYPFRTDANKEITKELTAPQKHFFALLSDPQQKLDSRFAVDSSLYIPIHFWLNIYARYDSRIRVVHDRENLGLIYGYLDFRSLHERFASKVLLRKKMRKIESQVLSQLRILLRTSAQEKIGLLPRSEELSSLRKLVHHHGAWKQMSKLPRRLRTQSGQKDVFHMAIIRANRLLPKVEPAFIKYRVPVGLSRIPFVESSFNVHARSRKGAMGLWQFTPETASEMISSQNKEIWNHPLVQSKAAARLLRMYKRVLPDWALTITAYNSGVGRVRRLVRKYKVKSYSELLRKKNSGLGFAGRNFYPSFVAATLAEGYKRHFFDLKNPPPQFVQMHTYPNLMEQELCLARE